MYFTCTADVHQLIFYTLEFAVMSKLNHHKLTGQPRLCDIHV